MARVITLSRTTTKTVLSLSTLLITGGPLFAGPLNPPAGPVTSTYKTVTEVEPRTAINATNTPGDADSVFRITQPGSYYLTGEVAGIAGASGIEVAADNVTIDLRGYSIRGVAGALSGITTSGIRTAIRVHDGSVRNWPVDGVVLTGAGHVFERLVSTNNSGRGLSAATARFEECFAASNGGHGFFSTDNCQFIECTARLNGGTGFTAGVNCVFDRCVAASNTSAGIALSRGVVTACSAMANGADGIACSSAATIHACFAWANTGSGISAAAGATITSCTANDNNTDGIYAGSGGTISGCTAASNIGDGIQVDFTCLVADNSCDRNGLGAASSAGIHATGNDNRVEGNNCTLADRGIDVDIGGNIILRNTCSGNTTNWDIAANNVVGPILDRTAPGSAAINGNSAPDSTGSTHPNANFTY